MLKMAFITLLREKREVEVSTATFDVIIESVMSEAYNSELMQLTFEPNKLTSGTSIKVECTENELEEATKLFLTLREPQRVDEGIFLPGGAIYVLGLRTTTMPNMLFSYNILDKTMTNRDRNIVDSARLQANVVKVLEKAKNQKFISVILSSFQENPNAFEYQLAFTPVYLDAWKKAMDKLYPKVCLSSDLKSDLTAHIMGYTVLRNVPLHLLQIFKKLGTKESSVYAATYQGEGLEQKGKIVYPIADTYVGDWTRADAIREFIANALDAGDPRLVYNGTEARISDSGEGIMKKNMVLGGTSKTKDLHAIGKFGEGMKMACLVMARTGSPVRIETVGTTYTAKLEYFEEFDSKLLVIEYVKNARTKGSSIVFACKEEEFNAGKHKFIHFQGVRKKPTVEGNLEVYAEGSGRVYINGLETVKKNGIFNYNILDKTYLDSRDRNSVNEEGLRRTLATFFTGTKDEDIIFNFLSKWKDNQKALEYEIPFTTIPSVASIWTKTVKKVFPKAAFASNGFDDSDFITKQAGFELLSNVPTSLRLILERAGIQSSAVIANKYRGKGIIFDNKIVYPISADYGKGWDIKMALKELIANAFDADPSAKISHDPERTVAVISDKGEGIAAKHMLFGETSKTASDDKIGLFGEGLKMAALVAVRNKRQFVVMTKGMRYEAKLERDTRFNADVLVIYLQPSRKRIGTDIEFGATADELRNAKNQFLVFNPCYQEIEDGIYEVTVQHGRQCVFVNGCFVNNINSIFSYNLKGKDMLNRDRKSVDDEKLRKELINKWMFVKNKKIIEAYMRERNSEKFELQLPFKLMSSVLPAWKAVAKKLFEKCCFASGTDHDGVARDQGYRLLMDVPQYLAVILRQCGILNSAEVVHLRGDEKDIKKRASESDLTEVGKERWKKAKKIFAKLYSKEQANAIEIVEEFSTNPQDGITLGLYNQMTDKIYILLELINNDRLYRFSKLMGTMIHEQMHRTSGEADRTRGFERALTDELGRLAEMI